MGSSIRSVRREGDDMQSFGCATLGDTGLERSDEGTWN